MEVLAELLWSWRPKGLNILAKPFFQPSDSNSHFQFSRELETRHPVMSSYDISPPWRLQSSRTLLGTRKERQRKVK